MKCAIGQAFLSVGTTELNGRWLRAGIVIAGRVQIAASAWLNVGRSAPRLGQVRYLGEVNLWTLSRSLRMRSFHLSLLQRPSGALHGLRFTTRLKGQQRG